MEVAMGKWSTSENKQALIVGIESIKACLRLALLAWFPNECIYVGGRFESHVPPPPAPEGAPAVVAATTVATPTRPNAPSYVGRRSKISIRVPETLQKYLDQKESGFSEKQKSELYLRVIAELLHIFRPVVFLALARKFQNKWIAFFVSMAMDVTSLNVFQHVAKFSVMPSLASAGTADEAEGKRRAALLLFYLFRTPLYEKTLGSFATFLQDAFKGVPGISMIAELISFQFEFYHHTHFYSAAS